MPDRKTHPPIALRIRAGADEVLAKVCDLARSPAAVRRGVRSMSVTVVPLDGKSASLDLMGHFLHVYPNLQELMLRNFESLIRAGTVSDSNLDSGDHKAGSAPNFCLRYLCLVQHKLSPYSARTVLGALQHMPNLSSLALTNIALACDGNSEAMPPSPYSLEMYQFFDHHEASESYCTAPGWTAPFTACTRRSGTISLSISLSNRTEIDELVDRGIDLPQVRGLSLFPVPASALRLSDYKVVVARCSNIRDLCIFAIQDMLVSTPFSSLFSSLAGPLRSIAIAIIMLDATAPGLEAIDQALAGMLEAPHSELRHLRAFTLFFMISPDSDTTLSHRNFPLLATLCRARRLYLVCEPLDFDLP